MDVLLAAVALHLMSGTAALVCSKWPRAATALGAGGSTLGCALGLAPTLRVLLGGDPESLRLDWDASHGAFRVEVDALGAFFLLPVFGLSALAAAYGGDYLLPHRRRKSLGGPWFFFNTFVAGMVLAVLDRTAFLFLVAWEVTSISAYFLVIFEQKKAKVRKAGWMHLVAAHLGVAFLFLAFVQSAATPAAWRSRCLGACRRSSPARPARSSCRPRSAWAPRRGLFLFTSGCPMLTRPPPPTSPP